MGVIIPHQIDLEDLKSRSDIVEVAADLGLKLKKTGLDYFTLCPAHDDHNPSLALQPGKGAKCFACAWSADVIGLVEKVKGCDTADAIHWLADRAGVAWRPYQGKGRGAAPRPAEEDYPKGAPLPEATVTASKPDQLVRRPTLPLVAQSVEVITVGFPADTKVTPPRPWSPYGEGKVKAEFTFDELVAATVAAGYSPAKAKAQVARIFSERRAKGKVRLITPAKASQPRPPKTPSLRVKVLEAFLAYVTPPPDSPGAHWLKAVKGIEYDTQACFGIGWLRWEDADPALRAAFSLEELDALGLLVRPKDVDGKKPKGPVKPLPELRFKYHRLIFPYWLPAGDKRVAVHFQARNYQATGSAPRFLRPYGSTPCPYNAEAVELARAAGDPVFLVEGETDCLTLSQSGRWAVCIPGAQNFKPEWSKRFKGLTVFTTQDADGAGAAFVRKVAEAFVAEGLPAPRVVKLPPGQDVTDFFTGAKTKKTTEEGN